jgi:menaquinone-dependent protoporphyrinogen oxidase
MNVLRYSLAVLLAFIAFNAFGGGVYGLAGAEGVPTEWLSGSPFRSYFVPSLVLLFVVGGASLAAAIAVYAEVPSARLGAAGAAAILATWMGVQIAIIGFVSWLQPAALGAALVVALMAWALARFRAPVADEPPGHADLAGSRSARGTTRVLVTWGSERGGTEGLARMLAEDLRRDGIDVRAGPADTVDSLRDVDAVIVGGALYMNRWHRQARRFVRRHARELCCKPVWFFSSGPLDATADSKDIPPTAQVAMLMRRIGARGHVTFGGRLARDASGVIAQAMAKTRNGDWRNPERVRAWADELAQMLPTARPGVASVPTGGLIARVMAYAGVAR